ncbi:Hypothetical predicted protein [Pelobates cultripes]|uniref:Uncharacterized protein n=1 Tax=Pelobates cultripes TaxID=61616 RepID=A0AAD1R6P6_PELCU|nr:Hypothetical predicted protein [Pelobates cultripes]
MHLIIKRRKENLKELDKEINKCQDILLNSTNEEQFENITSHIERNLDKLEVEVIGVKKNKYLRDVQDYELKQVRSFSKYAQKYQVPQQASSMGLRQNYPLEENNEEHINKTYKENYDQFKYPRRFFHNETREKWRPRSNNTRDNYNHTNIGRNSEGERNYRNRKDFQNYREQRPYRQYQSNQERIPTHNRYETLSDYREEEVFRQLKTKDRHKLDQEQNISINSRKRRASDIEEQGEESEYRSKRRDLNLRN